MRILFLQDRAYFSWGTGVKVNRTLAQLLAGRGSDVRAVVVLEGPEGLCFDPVTDNQGELIEEKENIIYLNDQGTLVTVCRRFEDYAEISRRVILEFEPETILFTESQTYRNLEILPREYLKRCVLAVHCTETLPFGPFSILPDREAASLVKATGGAVAVCDFLRDYLSRYGGKDSVVIPFPAYGPGPFPEYGNFDQGLVMMVNPSEIKGLSILIGLAQAFPDTEFGTVVSWAADGSTEEALRVITNIKLVAAHPDVDSIFRRTRILLVPSLWQEAFPAIVIEAMLRGIPVIASQVGGLPEAKLETRFVIPVNQIREWTLGFSAKGISFVPKIPKQDLSPWITALRTLLTDRREYHSLSASSRRAALNFYNHIRVAAFEDYFTEVFRQNTVS